MVAAVSPVNPTDFKQAELGRHLKAMSAFATQAIPTDGTALCCTLILRSAASAPAHALTSTQEALRLAGRRAKVIVAHLEPPDDLRTLLAALTALSPDEDPAALIRWTRNPRLLEAHEQVTYGPEACWSGDAMRRAADSRNSLALFETGAPEACMRAAQAFEALWRASVPVPKQHLSAGAPAKPSGGLERTAEAPLATPKPHIQGWPLLRH